MKQHLDTCMRPKALILKCIYINIYIYIYILLKESISYGVYSIEVSVC